jgi:hypothetical protein
MGTIAELKEQSVTETPLLLFECRFADGAVERWSTHQVVYEGEEYEARVLAHRVFEIRSAPEEGIDATAKVTVILANADSKCSQIERARGWKGSRLRVRFLFYDLKRGEAVSESKTVFQGVVNAPEELTETRCRLTATNSLSLQRVWLPDVRVQRRCPWKFPRTAEERREAIDGGTRGEYSPFFRCGYSADQPEGVGNLDGEAPFVSCDGTRLQCEQRGMFDRDSRGNPTRRFGGIEFVPPTTIVRSHGERGRHLSEALENEARYNDFVPLIYGTAWTTPLIVFARNDGNLTHIEALLGMGEIERVLKVLVNDVEVPAGQADRDMTSTGWYNVVSLGNRTGDFNLDFTDGEGRPLGDCYGSMAYLSVVVPNRLSDGRSLPRLRALVEGMKLARYDANGTFIGKSFTNNPAWVILDILRRCGWELDQIDLASFARTASYCEELIPAHDIFGNPVQVPRFQCNLVLKKRASAAEIIRGIRVGARLYLTYGKDGRLELNCENTLALQQPEKPEGSNSREPLNGGWPAYEFGDGTDGFSGILRRANGEPTVRVWSRSTAETPNRYSVEFQDAFNEYQQDSVSLVDVDDVLRTGQEVCATLPAVGIANLDQALRVVKFYLDKSIEGNTYIEFETSVKGFGLRPGDLITVTYLREGFQRTPFRVLKVVPGTNFGRAQITAQIHKDEWYRDDNLRSREGSRRVWGGQPGGLPRPLAGVAVNADGLSELGIAERYSEEAEGRGEISLAVSFTPPRVPEVSRAERPIVSLTAQVEAEGGRLRGGQVLYYAVSGVDETGAEGPLSFVVPVAIPGVTETNKVTLTGLRFSQGTVGFHVYRGPSPATLWRIAENQEIATSFTDEGREYSTIAPPDENFDHANFYWRLELQPEYSANIFGPDRIGNTEGRMPPDGYQGMVVRITRGKGAGQERRVVANDATTLIVEPQWLVTPDHTSYFVVAEAGWHLGATGRSSPVEFVVPGRIGATVHVLGRAANARGEECAAEISPFGRWRLGSGEVPWDTGAAGKPSFGLAGKGEGIVELVGVAFDQLLNTRSVQGATLTMHYWNELESPTPYYLGQAAAIDGEDLLLGSEGIGSPGDYVQVEQELCRVVEVREGGTLYVVERGVLGSQRSEHPAGTPIYHLKRKVYVVPFVRDFFGSRASGSYAYPIYLPDARIAAAELYVTNAHGQSETSCLCFTNTEDEGLRTLSGGQISLQVEGFLGIQAEAVPPFVVDETHSVRDIFAVVREPSEGGPIELRVKHDGQVYCELRIESGDSVSNTVKGFGLPPLRAGATLGLDIVSVGQERPGADLTVTIRL